MILREGGCVVGRRESKLRRLKKMYNKETMCIYHGNCADGFGAAWVVQHALGRDKVEFVPGVYQDDPPDVRDRDVILVDFSYKLPVITAMAEYAASMLILDHHASAAEDLKSLVKCPHSNFHDFQSDPMCEGGVFALFDMDRSGAGIAWDFFFPRTERPELIDVIEDRDLWRFDLEHTREIQANIFSYPYDFEVWDKLMAADMVVMAREGEAIERKHHKDIRELLRVTTRTMIVDGYIVPVANLPYTMTSDAGNILSERAPFAGCYWDTPDGRVFSLRSQKGGIDVSKIAAKYGGGGHPNASGFRLPYAGLEDVIPVSVAAKDWFSEEKSSAA